MLGSITGESPEGLSILSLTLEHIKLAAFTSVSYCNIQLNCSQVALILQDVSCTINQVAYLLYTAGVL